MKEAEKWRSYMDTVSPLELEAMLADRMDVVLVNVVDESEFAQERIPGSHNLPAADEEFLDKVKQLAGSKYRAIAVYGSGSELGQSEAAAMKLAAAGFSGVLLVEDGIEGWIDSGFDVESDED
jgi:rhodanese-related sulfurtransferase